jgi:hypothetical protein
MACFDQTQLVLVLEVNFMSLRSVLSEIVFPMHFRCTMTRANTWVLDSLRFFLVRFPAVGP